MTDDIDEAFRRWADDQLDAAEQHLPTTGLLPTSASTRSRDPRLVAAVACVVLLIVGLGFAATRVLHRGAATATPSACSANFRPSALQPLGEVGEIVDLDLTYTGKSPCTISTAPPRVTLTGRGGQSYPIAAAAAQSSRLTLHRGDVLTVSVTDFACGTLVKDNYALHVYLGRSPSSAGVTVAAGVQGGSRVGKPNYCGDSTTNGAVQALQVGIGTADQYRQTDTAKPNPRAGVGREWGLIQVTDPVRTVAIPDPSKFTFERTTDGQFSANDSVNDMGGTYVNTLTGFHVGSFGSTLAGYGMVRPGPVPIAHFTAIRGIDAISQTQGGVQARESNGVLDLHAGAYKLIFKDLGPAHSSSPMRGG